MTRRFLNRSAAHRYPAVPYEKQPTALAERGGGRVTIDSKVLCKTVRGQEKQVKRGQVGLENLFPELCTASAQRAAAPDVKNEPTTG